MLRKRQKEDRRTFEQIREHYEIEKELANKLRNSSEKERKYLYTALYDELFRLVPHHPQLTNKANSELQLVQVSKQIKLLNPFLKQDSIFVEVGPGDCSLSLEVSKLVKKVYAVDVSYLITKSKEMLPENFELVISDGTSVPVSDGSINIAYSNQLMEHLHPDDAFKQLQSIYKVLTDGGIYICSTPNRLNGPHDVSKYFDRVATGFHLKEYTFTELYALFHQVGFSQIKCMYRLPPKIIILPLFPIIMYEKFLNWLPFYLRIKIAKAPILRSLLSIRIMAKR